MAEYTWKNLIYNPTLEEAKNAIGKECYFGSTPIGCIKNANDDKNSSVLREVRSNEFSPFITSNYGSYSCIIVKKEEPKPKYVPFESIEEFIEAFDDHTHSDKDSIINTNLYLSGFWLKNIKRDNPVYKQVIAIQDVSVLIGTIEYLYPALLENFTFLDGTPCGKESKNE